jgi:threonine dehydrogenase-like Zn-dependent dehydrogenase
MSKAKSERRQPQRVLVVGFGTMGMSHARAYQASTASACRLVHSNAARQISTRRSLACRL